MKVLSWTEFKDRNLRSTVSGAADKPLAATVGVFDGLHIGHLELIGRIRSKAPAMASAVLTFRESPKKILRPATFHGDLLSLEDKLAALEGLGVDFCVLIDFSADFSTLSGGEFLDELKIAGVTYLTVGPDFRFGHRNDTDAAALMEICGRIGIGAEIVGPVLWAGHPVSSTRIRHAVIDGKLEEAARMLDRQYDVSLADSDSDSDSDSEPGREPEGIVRRFREGMVLPPPGLYRAEIVTKRGRGETTVRLAPGGVCIENSEGRKANRIVFLNKVSREL